MPAVVVDSIGSRNTLTDAAVWGSVAPGGVTCHDACTCSCTPVGSAARTAPVAGSTRSSARMNSLRRDVKLEGGSAAAAAVREGRGDAAANSAVAWAAASGSATA